MGCGGNRVNSKVCKLSNTYTKKFIEEVLEAHAYKNHNQEQVKNNYVIKVCEDITGKFDYDNKRLIKPISNADYNKNIQAYLKEKTEYYGKPDSKGRYHKISKDVVLMRELVFYLPNDANDRFRNDEDLFHSWCDDNMKWFKEQYKTFEIVAAVGHSSETSFHMHLLFLPTGEQGGKLANNKYFYDHDKDGKKCRTGATILSERQQSYINEVLHKYDIEGGIKGSKATHRDLNYYKSTLAHDVKELEERKERDAELCAEMETIEINELDRLYQVEAEHEEMISTLDRLFAEIYNVVPAFVQRLMENIADRFFKRGQEHNQVMEH